MEFIVHSLALPCDFPLVGRLVPDLARMTLMLFLGFFSCQRFWGTSKIVC